MAKNNNNNDLSRRILSTLARLETGFLCWRISVLIQRYNAVLLHNGLSYDNMD